MIEVPPPYRSFASDNVAGAHPAVLEAVIAANEGSAAAYGDDPHTAECEARFEALFGRPVTVRHTFNGTGANVMAFAAMLGALRGPVHAVVCTEWSHAHMDEAGAPERILGAKLIDLPSADARLRPEDLDAVASLRSGPHHAPPGIVTITQPTELGTLYVPDEIAALCARAHELGLLVHLDGARIANAVAALGGDASALRAQTSEAGVDVMSFGGTKNGALGAEAVVVFTPELATGIDHVRKQVTQLASKTRFLAAQFNALLDDDRWIALGGHANRMAARLHELTHDIPGVRLDGPPQVNSLFPCLAPHMIEPLREWSFHWEWDSSRGQVRWMTAWDTTDDDLERFAAGVRAAAIALPHDDPA